MGAWRRENRGGGGRIGFSTVLLVAANEQTPRALSVSLVGSLKKQTVQYTCIPTRQSVTARQLTRPMISMSLELWHQMVPH